MNPVKAGGLYVGASETDYKSRDQIQLEKMYEGSVSVNFPDRTMAELSFDELHEEFTRRAELRDKVEQKEYCATIEIASDRPVAVGWLADTHIGGQDIDYTRLKWEIDEIKANPYMKVFLGGDIADGFCWNPAQFGDIANLTEQNLYFHRMLDYLGRDKILGAVIGSHEKWSRRTGLDMYNELRGSRIPIFDGIGTIRLVINGIEYTGAIMHEAKGYSYFNPNHPQKRFVMENEGYDFVMSAHTHAGSEQSQIRQSAKGSRKVVFLSGKTFKRGDDFLDTKGFPRKEGDALGTNWIVFSHDSKMMRPMSNTHEALVTISD